MSDSEELPFSFPMCPMDASCDVDIDETKGTGFCCHCGYTFILDPKDLLKLQSKPKQNNEPDILADELEKMLRLGYH